MLSKSDLRVQMDAKSGQLKNESKSEIFSASGDAQESANGTTINAFKVLLIVQIRVPLIIHIELHLEGALQGLYKDAQKGAPENAPKGALQVALHLHLFMKLSMPKSVQNDSIKDET